MNIEIHIRTGHRTHRDDGTVIWDKYDDSTALVTYLSDDAGAIREALWQVERLLKQMLVAETV